MSTSVNGVISFKIKLSELFEHLKNSNCRHLTDMMGHMEKS